MNQQQSETTSATASAVTVSQLLQVAVESTAAQAQQFRELQKVLKKLSSEIEKEQRKYQKAVEKAPRTVVQKPVQVQAEMEKFLQSEKVEVHPDTGYTRKDMMRAVSAYIKTHNLQLEDNKKQWKPDAQLTKLFSLDSEQLYTFMNINGLLSRVIPKLAVAESS